MNQQEQVAQGSLQSSHRNIHAITLKRANRENQEQAIEYLNRYCRDLVISQRLNHDKFQYAEIPLKKGKFYVNTDNSKAESGFLVFLPNSIPIYVCYNISKREREMNRGNPSCYILRMRVSKDIHEGSVFVAKLDVISHNLVLEDIHVWKNINIYEKEPFSKRRTYMKEFVEKHWIADARLLGGIVTTILEVKPLSYLEELVNEKNYTKVMILPEMPGKRRFTFILNESVARIEQGFYGRQVEENVRVAVVKDVGPVVKDLVIEKKTNINTITNTKAKAKRVPLLPDVYELFDENNTSLGKACVQQLDLSKKLKEITDTTIMVNIQYNNDFNRYEITGL